MDKTLDITNASIMIIDDDPENLRVLATMLTQQGFVVRSFPSGSAALRSAQKEPPDLILLDVRMPKMDGFEVCARLKENDALSDIPVLFLSAVDETGGKVRAFELGGADYITKPFQAEEVLARAKIHLALRTTNHNLETLNKELEQLVRERTAALEESEAKYRRIVTTANEGIVTADEGFCITYANAVMADFLGGTVKELIGRPIADFIHEDDREEHQRMTRAHAKGKKATYECEIKRLDGKSIWVLISASPILDSQKRFMGSVGMVTDITERKQTEIGLRQSKEFNQAIMKSLGDHIAVLDRSGTILAVNESWIRFARENDAVSLDRIRPGASYLDACRRSSKAGSNDAQAAIDGIKSVIEGRIDTFELEYACHSPSKQRWFLMTVVPFKGRKGGAIVSHSNITDRKQSEIELKEACAEIADLKNRIEADNIYLREEIKLEHDFEQIIGNSDEIKYALFRVEQLAATDSAVIIFGETGTGKELFARAIHSAGLRSERPLIKVNCATLPKQFIESELFGHAKGAYTGAANLRKGRFEIAHQGTLFLDEIGELTPALQAKLLRVLQDGEFERLGDSRTIKTDVRVIAATNRDLEALVKAKKFRQDLWYRLNVFPITIPPLRQRKDDIPLLVNHFVKKIGKKTGKEFVKISKTVLDELMAYDWPGNVRELEHILERSRMCSSSRTLPGQS